MSATSASSLVLPSLNHPNTIKSFYSKPTSLSFISLSSTSSIKPGSLFLSFQQQQQQPLSSRFLRSVAISSEFGQEEDVFGDGDEPSFSPDLQLFVGNLPFNVSSAQLADLFKSAGNVEMVEVKYDKVTGRSRGFGFVTMSTIEEVEAASQQFNGFELDGRPLRVNSGPPPQRETSFSRGPGARGGETIDSSNRVYVGNLSWNVDSSALETLFREKGKVMDARVVFDRDSGRSKGFGFVTYSSAEEVEDAVDSLNGIELDGRAIRVSVAEAKPRRRF
ncbi:PREDICTED: ribonucleoprotein At2g37220, chloroplastic-like [Populus euphratica]|uniref:Ribonucleoprotein At2g37220, chloroplastic-like n=1 Tax=Populus euphratica TaxID=75702 RepID=A0AAJ6VJ84_POPEU|nr:PREDICTED: ribonucleoprotein At2g37220, chloroplastic-like [Populus euphratica]